MKQILLQGALLLTLGACATSTTTPAPLIKGPPVFGSETPYSAALACLGREVAASGKPLYSVGVGNVADRSGKFSLDNGGYEVSQSPDLMIITALSKSGAVIPVERLDTRPLEWELNLENQKLIGDTNYDSDGNAPGTWRRIHAGRIMGSDYYIVGAITGIDYVTYSGGGEIQVNGIGAGARQWREMVYADIRMVDTKSGEIVATGSPYKELVGVEVETGIFRFFGTTLVAFDAGKKASEPTQLGVRAMMERTTFDMLHTLYRLPPGDDCEKIAAAVDKAATDTNHFTGTVTETAPTSAPVVASFKDAEPTTRAAR
jgi:curli biogenesis system outer membrane secretion channel CsgG